MSLRARLALVLAGVMIGPLLAAWVVIGVLGPHLVGDIAQQSSSRAAVAVKNELAQICREVGDSGQLVANQLLASSVVSRTVTEATATDAAQAAQSRHPGVQIVVLDPDDQLLGSAGPIDAEDLAGAAKSQLGHSCAEGRASWRQPAMTEHVSVELSGVTEPPQGKAAPSRGQRVRLATVVVWYQVDDALLDRLARALALEESDDLMLIAPTAPGSGGGAGSAVASTLPASDVATVRARLADGALTGEVDGRYFEASPRESPVPFEVVGLSRTRDLTRLQLTLLGLVTVTAAGSLVLISVLAGRLTAPLEHVAQVADRLRAGDLAARTGLAGGDEVGRMGASFDAMAEELEGTVLALRERSTALSEMFDRFGEALGRSHDLNGLVRTVADAALLGADAAVGVVLLGDVGGLQVRACQVPDGDPEPAPEVAAGLGTLAGRAVERREPVVVAADGPDTVSLVGPALPAGLSGALALPMMKGDRVFGALAVARSAGAPPFDPETIAAIRALAGQAGTAVANVRQHEETRRQSVTDPLTGAGNFRHLSATLAREVERASRFGHPLAVLMLDLDHFKQVNDTLGHAFGDAVLREFARRLQQCLREVDTVARYGGEEFCVIAPETDPAGACRVADRIVEVVRTDPFVVGEKSRRVTVSVGVATHPQHGATAAELMGAADAALYAAKRTGRDRWVVAGSSGGRPATGGERAAR